MNEYIHTINLGNSNKSLSLELFNNKYSIVSTWEGKDGKTRANWCFRQERVNGENVPGTAETVKVILGDKAAAVSTLLQMLAALGHTAAAPKAAPGKPDQTMTRRPEAYQVEDDIPF